MTTRTTTLIAHMTTGIATCARALILRHIPMTMQVYDFRDLRVHDVLHDCQTAPIMAAACLVDIQAGWNVQDMASASALDETVLCA